MTASAAHPWLPSALRPLFETPGVTDILVNGPRQVWIDRGLGLERADAAFASAAEIREAAVRLASLAGRRLDDAMPLVDARLPDGTRMHAALPPVADSSPLLSFRLVRGAAMSLADLETAATLTPLTRGVLEGLVRARASILITGATGSGKTTLLASLLGEVSAGERIVVIEEAGELNPAHPHLVRLVERRANVDGAGGVGLPTLVREALRMRPDRIVLGEARGPEVREVLTALNTGHRGGMATLHANTVGDVPARLAALGALAGMGRRAVELHAAAAFDVVVRLDREGARRRVSEIGMLRMRRGAGLAVRTAFAIGADEEVAAGPCWPALAALVGEHDPHSRLADAARLAEGRAA